MNMHWLQTSYAFCINSFISYLILQFLYLRSLCWQFRNMCFEVYKWNMIQVFSFENLWKISTIWKNWWKLDHSSCQICSSTLLYCPIRLYCCIFLCWGSDEVFFWSSRFRQLCPGGLRPVADHSIMLDGCMFREFNIWRVFEVSSISARRQRTRLHHV